MTDALRHQTLKKALALAPDIGSRDIQDFIPAQIREMAQLSAKTPYAGYLDSISSFIGRMVQPDVRIGPDGLVPTKSGESISPAQVATRMRKELMAYGYEPDPAKRGGLQDLSSDRRINLIIDTQLGMSRGYGSWREAQDPTILKLEPADELYRAFSVRKPRGNWDQTWNAARASLGSSTSATLALDSEDGPFVALKNDPIWYAISRFRNPYPPFDYGSGMRVRGVTRREAIALGVLAPGDTVTPVKDPLTRPWTVALQDTRSDIAAALQTAFGDRALLDGGALHILPDPDATLKEIIYRAANGDQATGAFAFLKQSLQDAVSKIIGQPVKPAVTMEIDASHVNHIRQVHGVPTEILRGQVPISNEDIANLPQIIKSGIPRAPTASELTARRDTHVTFDCADNFLVGGSYSEKRNRILVTTMYKKAGEK